MAVCTRLNCITPITIGGSLVFEAASSQGGWFWVCHDYNVHMWTFVHMWTTNWHSASRTFIKSPAQQQFQELNKFMENEKQAQCCRCKWWSGHPRERRGVVMCAVNVPSPSAAELKKNGDRIAFTFHNCQDFEVE